MDISSYFETSHVIESPLFFVKKDLHGILKARDIDSPHSMNLYLSVAKHLENLDTDAAKTRGAFIRLQCHGIDTEDMFEEYRESWGIPKYEDNLVSFSDFKNGFLWTFRDHSTSWMEEREARTWFYSHIEGSFARRYEFYSCDRGPKELLLIESGDFKTMLEALVNKHKDYSPLVSPVFTEEDLLVFYFSFDEDESHISREGLLNILKQNPNWSL